METHYPDTETHIRRELSDLYLPEGIELWLHSRNQLLNMQRPLDLIEAGRGAEVLTVIESIHTGGL